MLWFVLEPELHASRACIDHVQFNSSDTPALQCAGLSQGSAVELLVPHTAAHQRPHAVKLLLESPSCTLVIMGLVLPARPALMQV
jgi:hypothetical protein